MYEYRSSENETLSLSNIFAFFPVLPIQFFDLVESFGTVAK